MSGKFAKKRAKKKNKSILIAIVVCAVLLAGLLLFAAGMVSRDGDRELSPGAAANSDMQLAASETQGADGFDTQGQPPVQDICDLGSNVRITGFLPYTGAFMEDRTDEVVTDVLAIQVTNSGEEFIQTMDITLSAGETQAQFSLSTLFPGETAVVLEKNRMAYSTAPEFEQVQTSAVALFEEHPGMCQDKLEIQCLDGVINVTNISDEDITEDVLIYYKNYVNGIYYGGITYRLRIEGGLKAGEIRQGSAAHFNPDNSTVVFVTCG